MLLFHFRVEIQLMVEGNTLVLMATNRIEGAIQKMHLGSRLHMGGGCTGRPDVPVPGPSLEAEDSAESQVDISGSARLWDC